jgi:AmmeMemoRadiSam system protein A
MPSLSDERYKPLLNLARLAITEAVVQGQLLEQIPTDGIFAEVRGVFVTLHVQGRLRGCIGVVEPSEPLGEAIVRSAVSAALQDPRFSPMRSDELAGLQIEISLLSPVCLISPEAIEIGRHGLLIKLGKQHGLLLPQVGTEHHLDRERFLQETCLKAGLPREAWRDPQAQIFGFTCEVFSEDQSSPPN